MDYSGTLGGIRIAMGIVKNEHNEEKSSNTAGHLVPADFQLFII